MNLFTKLSICAIALCFFTVAGTSQTVFWEYDFSDQGTVFTDWTSGGTNDGNQDWQWSNDPGLINFGAQPDFGSETASNGYIYFNSDANGENSHDITITSQAIDCSAASEVFITAENQYAYFSSSAISIAEVGVSTDGVEFTYYQIHTDVGQNTLTSAMDPVNVELPEAAGEPTVFIQFRWQGFFEYTWKIDDVKLWDGDPRPANDMRVNQFHAVPPNAAIPESQLGDSFGFIADIQNLGSDEQLNATLTVTINDGTTNVFTDELTYAMVGPDSVAENIFFDNEFTPDAPAGTLYTGTYELELENDDANANDNIREFTLLVSDTLFAKDNGVGLYATQPADDNDYRFGNVYYVKNGEGQFARYASFFIGNPGDLVGSSVTTLLYKWNGDENQDFQANPEEYEGPLGFNFYTITGDESGLISIPVSFDEDEVIELEDDTYYILLVEFAPGDDDTDNFLVVSSDIDYSAMNFYQDSVGNADKWAVALDVGNTGEFSLVGFGFDVVPVVRLSIGDTPPLSNVSNPLLPVNTLNVFPTVADEQIWAEIALEETAKELNLTIVAADGRVVQNNNFDNVKEDKIRLNIAQLATGNYFIRLQTEEGIRTKPFIIQR
jgi:hypothetical protein